MKRKKISISDHKFEVELAERVWERAWGLSFRDEGKMLFAFPRDITGGFHMATLSIPLQMTFIDSDKKVIEVKRAEPWTWHPKTWKIYKPEEKFRYVLETSEFYKIERGDRLKFI